MSRLGWGPCGHSKDLCYKWQYAFGGCLGVEPRFKGFCDQTIRGGGRYFDWKTLWLKMCFVPHILIMPSYSLYNWGKSRNILVNVAENYLNYTFFFISCLTEGTLCASQRAHCVPFINNMLALLNAVICVHRKHINTLRGEIVTVGGIYSYHCTLNG